LKITKSKLVQIIKEEVDEEVESREKKAALEAMLATAKDKPLTDPQLEILFGPKSNPEDIKEKLKKLQSIKSYRDALDYLLSQEPAIDPEGNPL